MLKGDNIGKINNLENRVAKLETTPSGGSPSGSTPDVQYNNGGVFGAITSNTTATQKFLSQVSTGVPTWETIDLSGYLTLDQTTPQHIINGAPIFDSGLEVGTTGSLGPSGTANAVINSDGSASFGGGSASINYDGTFVVNSLGLDDTFFAGSGAGSGATNASSSNFFGSYAGFGAYDASSSNFFGTAAGSGAVNPDQLQTAQYMNPYTQNVVDATTAALQQQQGQQLSQQQTQAIKSGAFGGNRSGLERAVLQGQQGLATAQAISPLYQRGYEQALATAQQQQGVNLSAQQANQARLLQGGQQLAGLGAAAQTAGLQGANALQQAGATQQQTTQAGLGALYNQWLQKQGYPYQQAQFLANIAEGTGSLSGSTTTTNQPAPFFGSDRRLKHDVKRIGETDKGLPIYSFKYKDDPEEQTRIGFMADEVEKRHPEDVGLSGGYKTVNYEGVADKESRPHRYDGGLVPDSAGGAVMPEMSGEGYAEGGMAGASDFVPPMRSIFGNPGAGGNAGLAQVLAAQQGSGQRKLMMPSQGLKPITPEFNQLLGAGM